jgi:alkanesulfonate monooxygenase SsuD/methylene tetrahydromethanopterin reductase-like flavin-dependent oxidoreductase (luciferase family)
VHVGLILPMGDDDRAGVPVSYRSIVELALAGEDGGLDALWVYDHLLAVEDGQVSGQWEAWTVLSALAAATTSVALGTLVSCTGFRHPALHAKMAQTVQEISGGRFTLGLGAGWHEPEYRAFGFPFDRRVARFAESIEVIATMLRDGRASFAGEFVTVEDAVLLPPLSDRRWRTPVLVGCRGERMLRLTARWADAWNTAWYGLPDERFTQLLAQLGEACAAEDRDPSTVDVTVGMVIGGSGRARIEPAPGAVADALAAWHDQGVAHVVCWPDPTDRASVDLLLAAVQRYRGAR